MILRILEYVSGFSIKKSLSFPFKLRLSKEDPEYNIIFLEDIFFS
jgi:hypothetical protein